MYLLCTLACFIYWSEFGCVRNATAALKILLRHSQLAIKRQKHTVDKKYVKEF